MKFIDEIKLEAVAGKGGNGIISFRREKYVPFGGPDGGNGGQGGNIYFLGDPNFNTLSHLKSQKRIHGFDGQNGKSKNKHGANGKDLIINFPLGTIVTCDQKIIANIVKPQKYLVARGGRGGFGNAKFRSSKNPLPKISENGDLGQQLNLKLSLKLLADMALVGLPSVGKSTLLSKITNAKPRIASYDFTTLNPQLGLLKLGNQKLVIADLPGLIEAASQGKGLGIKFLKHIERCCLIIHVLDFGSDKNPINDYQIINQELKNYYVNLTKLPQIIVANKKDLSNFEKNVLKFQQQYPHLELIQISALKNYGLNFLKRKLFQIKQETPLVLLAKPLNEVTIKLEQKFIIKKSSANCFEISGPSISKIYQKIPLNSYQNLQRFKQKLVNLGVWKQLLAQGLKPQDKVKIFGYEFEWNNENY